METTKIIHFGRVNEEGKRYEGDFTVSRMTIGDKQEFSRVLAEMNGGKSLEAFSESALSLNFVLATLQVMIKKAPEWWQPQDFFDTKDIYALYNLVKEWEKEFFRPAVEDQKT